MYKNSVAEQNIIISHQSKHDLNLNEIAESLKNSQDLALPLAEELKILEEPSQFELGKWLVARKS